MNKELDDLENYLFNEWKQNHVNFGCDYKLEAELEKQLNNLKSVKQALQRLESIDNAKPSEALETLKDMLIGKGINDSINDYVDNLILPIKQALLEFRRLDLSLRLPDEQSSSHFTYKNKNLVCMQLAKYSELMNAFLEYEKAQEQEKVLEIIKEKRIDLESFYSSFVENDYDYDYNFYEKRYGTYGKYELTQEEFDLLKEVLK